MWLHEVEYSDPIPQSLQCPICLLPFSKPYSSLNCGHTFCYTCIQRHFQVSNTLLCPLDRTEIKIVPSPRLVTELLDSLSVFCSRRSEEGCLWSGKRSELDSHLRNTHNTTMDSVNDVNRFSPTIQAIEEPLNFEADPSEENLSVGTLEKGSSK
jgi:hypothetical protein